MSRPDMDADLPETWRMHGQDTPALGEYLMLAAEAGWGSFVATGDLSVTFGDALIVLDMQNDHLPVDQHNQQGGSVATLEASSIVPLVVDLMEHFAAKGGMVVATRDYHPSNHCSFIESLGPFPSHCVQGTAGAHFYKPIGECIQRLRQAKFSDGQCEVVFKGFHEDIDSPGGFEYSGESPAPVGNESLSRSATDEKLGGYSLNAWTGASLLKCSNLDADVNAAPDVLAAHRRTALPDLLLKKKVKRVFVCGLTLGQNVLGTAMNAASAGFPEAYVILDASRAAHLSGVGKIGSGFLHDPKELTTKIAESGVKLIPAAAVLPKLEVVNPIDASGKLRACFPSKLGPFNLIRSKKISLYVDREENTYRAVAPLPEIRNLESHKVKPEGIIAPPSKLTLDADARKRIGIPANAESFTYAYPLGAGSFLDEAHAYFAITTPSAAFFVYGGFIYFDAVGKVVAVMAMSLGDGLDFCPAQPWPAEYTTAIEDRWCQVTMPFQRERDARLFAWINPAETLVPVIGGEKFTVGEHGAFVYLFHEDLRKTDERDCFFCVSPDVHDNCAANIGRCACDEEDAQQQLRATSMVRSSLNLGTMEASTCVMQNFQEWDTSKSGTITEAELTEAMQRLDPSMTDATIAKLFKAADSNRDGVIQFEEFVKWLYG